MVDVDRHPSPYAPLTRGGRSDRRHRPFLRTARLNLVGWLAVVGSCLAAAGLGFAAGWLLGLPRPVTASVGGLLPLALLVAADRRRWAAMFVGYRWGGTPAEVSAVVADLNGRGVAASAEIDSDGQKASLQYRNADAEVVHTVLAAHGVPAPRHRF